MGDRLGSAVGSEQRAQTAQARGRGSRGRKKGQEEAEGRALLEDTDGRPTLHPGDVHTTFMTGWAKYRALQSQKPVCVVAETKLLCPAASSASSVVFRAFGDKGGLEIEGTVSHIPDTSLCRLERIQKETEGSGLAAENVLLLASPCVLVVGTLNVGPGPREPVLGRRLNLHSGDCVPHRGWPWWLGHRVCRSHTGQRCEVSNPPGPLRQGLPETWYPTVPSGSGWGARPVGTCGY